MTSKKISIVILLLAVLLLASACGGTSVVRGAAPIVRMNELSHADNIIKLQLSIRNLNGVDMDVESIDVSMMVEEDLLFTYKGNAQTNISPNGIETWSIDLTESPSTKQLLDKLQSGEINSLPYTLDGSVIALDEGTLRFSHEGHIYIVPGKPGHFR